MTFAAQETSRSKGEPITLYHFQYGADFEHYFGYTDAETSIVVDGRTYEPQPIVMGNIRSSGTLERQPVKVRTPQNVRLADLFRLYPPSQVISLVQRRGHVGDPDNQFLVTWVGRVLGCERKGNEAEYTCEPVSTSLKRKILRRHYMYGCPHVLYGAQCRASKAAATSTKTVLSVSGSWVTLASNWATADRKQKYVGGTVEWIGLGGLKEVRTIQKVEGPDQNQLLLGGEATGMVAGMSIDVILGCNRLGGLEEDCLAIHGNIHNFGGFLWIPTKNPIGIKNSFY
jgi:hypothetical protein